jgi:anti-sigma regulatory factor (Ser/Thr protein kinase)
VRPVPRDAGAAVIPAPLDRRAVLARSAPLWLGAYDSSPRTARASARAWLSQWGRADLSADTESVVAELVANAVRASERDATPAALRLVLAVGSVVVEVFDTAPGLPAPREADYAAESGRGLHVVAALSREWGWAPARGGKVVWARVPA